MNKENLPNRKGHKESISPNFFAPTQDEICQLHFNIEPFESDLYFTLS